jgi:hypothetical protein
MRLLAVVDLVVGDGAPGELSSQARPAVIGRAFSVVTEARL